MGDDFFQGVFVGAVLCRDLCGDLAGDLRPLVRISGKFEFASGGIGAYFQSIVRFIDAKAHFSSEALYAIFQVISFLVFTSIRRRWGHYIGQSALQNGDDFFNAGPVLWIELGAVQDQLAEDGGMLVYRSCRREVNADVERVLLFDFRVIGACVLAIACVHQTVMWNFALVEMVHYRTQRPDVGFLPLPLGVQRLSVRAYEAYVSFGKAHLRGSISGSCPFAHSHVQVAVDIGSRAEIDEFGNTDAAVTV